MVSNPALTPLTTPPATVALVFEALHTPPLAASVRVILAPTQTDDAPLILPASGVGLTSIVFVATAVPQLLVTV